jgi:hypothetical protein
MIIKEINTAINILLDNLYASFANIGFRQIVETALTINTGTLTYITYTHLNF